MHFWEHQIFWKWTIKWRVCVCVEGGGGVIGTWYPLKLNLSCFPGQIAHFPCVNFISFLEFGDLVLGYTQFPAIFLCFDISCVFLTGISLLLPVFLFSELPRFHEIIKFPEFLSCFYTTL